MKKKRQARALPVVEVDALEVDALDAVARQPLGSELGLGQGQLDRWRRGRSDRPPSFTSWRERGSTKQRSS